MVYAELILIGNLDDGTLVAGRQNRSVLRPAIVVVERVRLQELRWSGDLQSSCNYLVIGPTSMCLMGYLFVLHCNLLWFLGACCDRAHQT